MRPLAWLGVCAVSTVAIAASCTFPEIDLLPGGAGASGQTSSTATGTAGATTSSSATTTTNGSGASGGAASGTGGACIGTGGSGGAVGCDVDKDDAGAAGPPCCGDDCDDGDDAAFPDQAKYFDTPLKTKGGYDFNCNGLVERDTSQLFKQNGMLDCSGATDCTSLTPPEGYVITATCGKLDSANYYKCQGLATNCNAEPFMPKDKLRCR